MENPEGWDLLTSSLAVSKLTEVDETWAFLRSQDLVVSRVPAQRDFERIVAAVLKEGDITGPSEAFRVAARLKSAGLTTELAETPDPWGETANRLLKGSSEA